MSIIIQGGVLRRIAEGSGTNAGTVTVLLGNTNVLTLDLGTVGLGERIIFQWKMNMAKGGTAGNTAVLFLKNVGTAVIQFYDNVTNQREDNEQRANQQWTFTGSVIAKVTTGGTLDMVVRMSSAGSNGTINPGDGELFFMRLAA